MMKAIDIDSHMYLSIYSNSKVLVNFVHCLVLPIDQKGLDVYPYVQSKWLHVVNVKTWYSLYCPLYCAMCAA